MDITTTITSGPTEILSSGTVIAFFKNPITIITKGNEETLRLVIKFEDDGSNESTVIPNVLGPDDLELTLKNFKEFSGKGNVKPMQIGTYEGKTIFLSFRVYDLGYDSDKILTYTLYRNLQEEDENE